MNAAEASNKGKNTGHVMAAARDAIRSLNGLPITAALLTKLINCENASTHLKNLAAQGEIEFFEFVTATNGRPARSYIATAKLMQGDGRAAYWFGKLKTKDPFAGLREVYPEMFAIPQLQGKLTVYRMEGD